MSRLSFLRVLVAAGSAIVLSGVPALADEEEERGIKYEFGNLTLNFMLDAGLAGFSASNTNFGIGTRSVDDDGRRKGTRQWFEYFVKPAVGLEYDTKGSGVLYGLLSVIGAGTRGDAANPSGTAARPDRARLEDAAFGWKSGDLLFLDFGENAIDVSAGNQTFSVGDGFMIFDGTADGNRRGAIVVGPRLAFEKTAIVRINAQPVRADLFRLQAVVDQKLMSETDGPHTELYGANIEWFESSHKDHGRFEYESRKWYVGLMALHVTAADSTGARNFSFADGGNGSASGANRDGLNVYSARVGGKFLPMLPDFAFYGEYGIQRNSKSLHEVRANAWYFEPQYTLSMLPWTPRIGYRYAHFSGDGDPTDQKDKSWDSLFPETGPRGIGTWTHGEIYGRYVGGNSNVNLHQIHLRATPIDEKLNVGVLFYRFNFDQPRQTAGVTEKGLMDEVNVYAEWETPVKGLSIAPLVGAARSRDGLRQSLGTDDRNDRTFWLGQVIALYKF
jgi:hypothetical protein